MQKNGRFDFRFFYQYILQQFNRKAGRTFDGGWWVRVHLVLPDAAWLHNPYFYSNHTGEIPRARQSLFCPGNFLPKWMHKRLRAIWSLLSQYIDAE